MGVVKLPSALVFRSTEGQMMAILAGALLVLFATVTALELVEHETPLETAAGGRTLERLKGLVPVLQRVGRDDVDRVVALVSSCHAGYTVTDAPFATSASTAETRRLESSLAGELSLQPQQLKAGHAHLTRDDFSYRKCGPWEIDLPLDGIVISLQLQSGRWLNAEIHPHEWHFAQKLDWMLKVAAAFVFVGAVALFFMRRLSRPLNQLTAAARSFADGMQATEVEEDGPVDLRRAIRSFNAMQRQVAGEIARRTGTLAAISHDVRTPLTALRVKAEMVGDPSVRDSLIASIERMERITASALEYLKGESRGEPMRPVDLSALLESECAEFEEFGHDAAFTGEHGREPHVPAGGAGTRGSQPDRQCNQVRRQRACRAATRAGHRRHRGRRQRSRHPPGQAAARNAAVRAAVGRAGGRSGRIRSRSRDRAGDCRRA